MSQTLTRAILTEAIYSEIGISQAEASEIIDEILEKITETLESGDSVKISSFGTFEVREKDSRIGRNPKTKEEVMISPRTVVTFRASNIMKKKINSGE